MLILVMGKNGSGKSAYAEKLTATLCEKRYYIATMLPYGEEGAQRVEKHIVQREELNFITLELPYSVGDANVCPNSAVLLEDVSNLLANAVFEKSLSAEMVLRDIESLYEHAEFLVAVTIDELDESGCDAETLQYIKSLTWLNGQLSTLADVVIEMRNGTPFFRKGGEECLTRCGLQ